jgi:Putative zinc-finger
MSTSQRAPRSHEEAYELIPWLVNGRLDREEQARLERHVGECEDCRREVEEQRRLRSLIRQPESNVEYAPQASFQKLWSRIEASRPGEGSEPEASAGPTPRGRKAAEQAESRPPRWMLAAATVLALGLGFLVAASWRAQAPDRASEYRTATAPAAEPDRDGQIRAVFSPNVTVDELTRIVSETRLTIVSGPSDSGVYTLAVQPGQDLPVTEALARLRSDPRVRFAEPVVTSSRGQP